MTETFSPADVTLAGEIAAYPDDPVGFAHDILNVRPDPWQRAVLEAIRDHDKVAIRSSTGQGKDFVGAIAVLWFLASFDRAYCPCTANSKDQLQNILWKQFADLIHGSNGLESFFEWQATTIRHRHPDLAAEWFAFATTSAKKVSRGGEKHAEGSSGHHSEHMLVLLDEASGVEEEFWGAYEFTLTGAHNKIVAIGNPNRLSGSFYQIWNKPSIGGFWNRYTIAGRESKKLQQSASSGDNVFVSDRGNQSGNHDYLIAKWGANHPWVESKVFGLHPTSSSIHAAYAYDQVMAARVPGRIHPRADDPVQIGIDIALRRDRIVYTVRRGHHFRQIVERKQSMHHIITMGLELAESEPDATAEEYDYKPLIVTDDGGLADASNWFRRAGHGRVWGVHFGGSARNSKLYENIAAEMWLADLEEYFRCRHCGRNYESHFDDAVVDDLAVHCDGYDPNCEIPGDETGEEADELLTQLITREWKPTGKKRDQRRLESKAEMFARTGLHSPDHADSLCLSVARPRMARVIA